MEEQHFIKMVNRYLQGVLNNEEYGKLTELLQEDKYRDMFDRTKQQWELNPMETLTGKRNWNSIQYKIQKKNDAKTRIVLSRRRWLQIASVAALLVVTFLTGGIVSHFLLNTNSFNEPLVFETPRGEKSVVTLSDGTQVWLNASSKLVCHKFGKGSREVELTGEAFFKVAHNEHAPFHVKTDECVIDVLGTEFNVMAYRNFGRKEITLVKGKVNVKFDKSNTILAPGEALTVKDHKFWVSQTDASHSYSWIENKFDFQNISLTELVKRLENWYDIDIDLVNPGNKDVNFTGTFKNEETIWEVLDAIRVYIPIQYEKTTTRKIKMMVK